jgi:hypothetical protein
MMTLAVMSVVAATASAEAPEFGRCVKVAKGTGSFNSGNCTLPLAGANYEWLPGPGANNKFTFVRKEPAATLRVLETVGGTPVICQTVSGVGQYAGIKTVGSVVLTLKGCESGSLKCASVGAPTGTIVTSTLEGALGLITKGETPPKDKVGLDLLPVEKEGLVAQFDCAGLPFAVRGSVVAPVVSNRMQLMPLMKFKHTKGKQKPERFEGEPRDVLELDTNGGPFEQAGMALEALLTNEVPIEINSVF